MISRRLLLAAPMALALPGPGRAASPPGTLKFGLSTYPPNLLPFANVGASAGTVNLMMRRGLLSYGADGKVRGELAESWARDGDTGWGFRLRDAVFQNGRPVTSADVKYSLEQIAAENSTAYLRTQMQAIARIDTPDARSLRIVMKQPTVTLPDWLATPYCPVICRDAMDANGLAVGAGPFVLTAFERGVGLDMVAFDRFYKPGLPKLKSLHFVAYADENLRFAALQAGDVDLIEYVPWQSMASVEADPQLKLDAVNGPFMFLMFNGRTGPFTDARVRNATGFAIRREDIVKTAFFGRGAPLNGLPIPPGSEYYDEGRANYWRYDPAHAKELLAQAGHPNGFACKLLATAQYGMHKDTALVVQQCLGEIGIACELMLPDWGTRVSMGQRGQYEICVHGTATDTNDPDGLAPLVDGSLPPSYGRSFGVATPGLAELLAAGRAEFDTAKRHAIYARAEQLALDQAPFVGLAWRSQGYGMRRSVQGFRTLPGALTVVSGISLEATSNS